MVAENNYSSDQTKTFTYEQRLLFQPKYFLLRNILIIITLIGALYLYRRYAVVPASFVLFISIYLMGGFKTRRRIDIFYNEHPATIATIMINLFNSSREEIKIFCGSLNPEIYCNKGVIEALEKALSRGVAVYIITDYEKAEKRSKSDPYCGEFEILKWAQENRLQMFDYKDGTYDINHFIIVDRKSFRLEDLHDESPVSSRKAVTAYNNKRAEKLLIYFDTLIHDHTAKRVSLRNHQTC